MQEKELIKGMLRRGGLLTGVKGETIECLLNEISKKIDLPASVTHEQLYASLCEREKLMATSVGFGIALPHPVKPIHHFEDDERIAVCFLDPALHLDTMDGIPVYVLFVVLVSNPESHLKVLSFLSKLFLQDSFRAVLQQKPDLNTLISAIDNHI